MFSSKENSLGAKRAPFSSNTTSSQRVAAQAAKRASSGAFAQLTSSQIQELKEAFALLDKDGDGNIGREDVKTMLTSLNQDASEDSINHMFESINPPINLAAFLTAMGSMLCRISPRNDLLEAFSTFDDTQSGKIPISTMRDALSSMGDRMDPQEVESILRSYTSHGVFYYEKFVDAIAGSKDSN
ncbi:Myosin II regulatory light chain Rlc1 [Schizosaccharomyces pombe]|uniref:Myosin regulatory light chain 1 n=1 Tax=Schizosaccharomyces pombe (strain 972 / ATCC 24843) TaxID=284812 RepID=MLR1_SCHPO|nr:myosin II regulatory light chain Rlc1 [Schizosaccharomyces pombe]Q9UUG5.1 RecName: Full=Myosin regulatory light chain 1 [Schizosaccharomyces pombe 972h-]CAB54151.1 myosin II regulatory light chain Rlc1 [Schizosaccharomyces pombe]|eukprot:NP_594364.1 myosin II regulatory light chain Rlc1 [Schizosaccharomyces pombe]